MRNFLQFTCKFNIKQIRQFNVRSSQPERRVCIVGGGPAGFYAAQYIAKHLPESQIDIVEKLPVPFGLVRFGVAPDHPEVKNVINTFTKTAELPNVRFLGNLSLGTDLSLKMLRERYHAIILAYGAEKDRKLNIQNEDVPTVLSAREFVAWYNGLPGSEHLKPDLTGNSIAVIGQGNVAIDVSRILLSPISALSKTDITAHALQILAESQVKKVYLIGRRGPLQAAFTIKELREMTKLPNVRITWKPEDFTGIPEQIPHLPRARKRIIELMVHNLNLSATNVKDNSKEFLPVFFRSPKVIDNLKKLQLTVNELSDSDAVPTDRTEDLTADLVLRSIGYKAVSVDSDLNFDDRKGVVINEKGRVLRKSFNSFDDNESKYEHGLYVCGWLATGPTGVIVTTMNNSFSVADVVCQDFASGAINVSAAKPGMQLDDFPHAVTWDGWKRIDKVETDSGKLIKPREKIINIREMLDIALA